VLTLAWLVVELVVELVLGWLVDVDAFVCVVEEAAFWLVVDGVTTADVDELVVLGIEVVAWLDVVLDVELVLGVDEAAAEPVLGQNAFCVICPFTQQYIPWEGSKHPWPQGVKPTPHWEAGATVEAAVVELIVELVVGATLLVVELVVELVLGRADELVELVVGIELVLGLVVELVVELVVGATRLVVELAADTQLPAVKSLPLEQHQNLVL